MKFVLLLLPLPVRENVGQPSGCKRKDCTVLQVRNAAFDARVLLGDLGHCDRQLVWTGNKHVHTHID